MCAFARAWLDLDVCSQAVSKLPWEHNLELVYKLRDPDPSPSLSGGFWKEADMVGA
jgi:hypothetical protein